MSRYILTLVIMLLLLPVVQAADPEQEQPAHQTHAGCPAHRAAELGHNPFDTFHEIMAPAWHEAWPNEDYAALIAAGPKFKEAFAGIAAMKPLLKTKVRQEKFEKARDQFAEIVNTYAVAAAAGDRKAVYDLMPKLHDAFEMTAATLLPVSFPEIEAVATTLNLILETHLAEEDIEGVVGSTETLVAKVSALTDTALIPDELNEKQEAILADVNLMQKLVDKMKESCNKEDMEAYREHAAALKEQLKAFFEKYI
ncbi:MAG: hypothetical protein AB1744_04980 [Candidatus Zixiibacteriota bacterium]